MVRPKKLGAVQSLSTQNKDFFSTKYSLKAKAGGQSGLVLGQEIYCIPLTANGIYEMNCHQVREKEKNVGFKSMFGTYIPCHGYNDETGEVDPSALCCRLAQEEWDKVKEEEKAGRVYKGLIGSRTSRVYLPVLLLGNDSGSKNAGPIPITKLTMSGRDFCYLEFSKSGFKSLIDMFTNDLLNNGRMAYELEGEARYDEILNQFQKHILKISITKPEGFGTHKKVFSFISFTNPNIGAETNSYRQITEGLTKAPKLQAEVNEFITLFESELEGILTPWNDFELENYVHNQEVNQVEKEKQLRATGTPVQPAKVATPKEEQVVIEDDGDTMFGSDDGDDDLFDGSDEIQLEEPTTTAPQSTVDIPEDDVSFELEDDEDFFGDE